MRRKPEYLVGVDLGQANDYTAVAVLYRTERETGHTETRLTNWWSGERSTTPVMEGMYEARFLERLQRGTPYPRQVQRVKEVIDGLKRRDDVNVGRASVRLVVDQTGVGRPVVDMLRAEGLKDLIAVTIHGGDQSSREGREHRVPKRELVSVVQVLLQGDRLGIASSLPEASVLTAEMLAFKVKVSAAGHDSYGNDWRENPHDDLVLAVALAAWAGERIARPGMVIY